MWRLSVMRCPDAVVAGPLCGKATGSEHASGTVVGGNFKAQHTSLEGSGCVVLILVLVLVLVLSVGVVVVAD